MIATIEIKDGEYTDGQKTLLQLWNRHVSQVAKGMPDVGVIFTLPRTVKKSMRKRFEGFEVRSLSLTADHREVVSMSTDNFLLLMAKSGIKVEIKERSA